MSATAEIPTVPADAHLAACEAAYDGAFAAWAATNATGTRAQRARASKKLDQARLAVRQAREQA